jgi:para-nitrobenzyl esterase
MRSRCLHWIIGVAACLMVASLAAAPRAGAWFDRSRVGHGMDWQVVGDRLLGGMFTFDAEGQPIWYQIDAALDADGASGELLEFRAAGDGLPTLHRRHAGLEIRRRSDAADCGNGDPRPGAAELFDLRFRIDGEAYRWCVEPILPAATLPESLLSGVWYGGEEDRGWGLVTYRFAVEGGAGGFSTLYVYDAAGVPRWAYAGHPADATDLGPWMVFARGYCRTCAARPLEPLPAGDAHVRLVTPRNDVEYNRVALGLDYPFGVGGRFVRNERPLRVLIAAAPLPAVVATREGIVEGTIDAGLTRFLGVPYVAAPLDQLRWRAPQPAPPRTAVLRADARGPACPQNAEGDGIFQGDLGEIAEDCLQLNVWSPVALPAEPLPVMVWLHGGGLTQGSAVEQRQGGGLLYDGARLADDGVVLVSINYRLGPLGFLAMREFAGEAPDHPSAGNYGLLDQIAALQWVRDNIAAFGGDPERVTIFGESAGGRSVCALLTSPLARGLFHRGIIQSGACPVSLPKLDSGTAAQPSAYAQGDRVIGLADCAAAVDRIACMRGVSWQRLIEVTNPRAVSGLEGENFGHAEDGYALPTAPGNALAMGQGAPVPLIVGVNADEMTTLLGPAQQPATDAAYQALVRQVAPLIANQVLELYPAASYATPTLAYADLVDDIAFACPARAFSRKHAAAGHPTFRYVYTHVFANASAPLGAFHGAEIAFVFGPGATFTAAETELSRRVQRYWTRFATSGDPNGADDPPWPQRTLIADLALELDDQPLPPISDYRGSYCEFWSQFIAF